MISRFLFFALVLTTIILSINGQPFTLGNRKILDQYKRQMYFHGTNIVSTRFPFIPSTDEKYDQRWSFNDIDMKFVKSVGFNAIRLSVSWEGAQPKQNSWNQTYFQQMLGLINKAGQKYGIYTMIQFHTDNLAKCFCGDGIPQWVVDKFKLYKTFPFPLAKKYPVQTDGAPLWSLCRSRSLSNYYFADDVAQAYNQLYNPKSKLFHYFAEYWQKVAQYFKGNKYVFAYELINEPWVGNLYKNPTLLIPGRAQKLKFQNFYDHLSLKIREKDQKTPLCFQPVTFDNTFKTGFSHTPGGNKFVNQSIFCFHYYSPPSLSLNPTLNKFQSQGKRLNVGAIISQTFPTPQFIEKAEQLKLHWMYWNYKNFFHANESLSDQQRVRPEEKRHKTLVERLPMNQLGYFGFQDHMVRTYFQRVAGELIDSRFDFKSKHFVGSYWVTSNAETVLYFDRYLTYFNQSYQLTVQPKQSVQIRIQDQFIHIKYIKDIDRLNKPKIGVTLSKI